MKFKFEKNMRIIADLIAYCHKLGAVDYHVDMSLGKEVSVYQISCPIATISLEKLEELCENLNAPRQHEIEQNYWGLSGDMDTGQTELELVGMMVDEANITYENGTLSIVVRRIE